MNGNTHGFGLSGPLTVQDLAASFRIVASVVVLDATTDDFVWFEFMIVTASQIAPDIARNENIISTVISPADILSDFLQYLNQNNMQRMKRGTAKARAGPTMSPTLSALEARESKQSGIFSIKL